jgi:hypothetical protein
MSSNRSRFSAYRTPFHDESCSERLFAKTLENPKSFLLPIGRQVPVFEKEKLDLLAIDQWAIPWIFEFKRDVAPYGAISQLLTYGSYVSQWSRKELEDTFSRINKRRKLPDLFKARFKGFPLRRQLTNRVNLVLAAFEFSLPCRRALAFLQESVGLTIGRLKIDCLWNLKDKPRPEYRWLCEPVPTNELQVHVEQIDPLNHYMLSMLKNEMLLDWSECHSNGLLPIPRSWNILQQPIPTHSGVFVHLLGLDVHFEDESQSGLLGYGITQGPAFDLWSMPREFEFGKETQGQLNESDGPCWVLPVKWLQKRHIGTHVRIEEPLDREFGLHCIKRSEAAAYKKALEVGIFEEHFDVLPFLIEETEDAGQCAFLDGDEE